MTGIDPQNPEKPGVPRSESRYHRYRSVIESVAEAPVFDLQFIQQHCQPERPAFVTRIVNELVRQGWLLREDDGETRYRWNTDRGDFSINRWLDDKIYGSRVKARPVSERPRERLLEAGAASLPTSELLAILVRSGLPGESAVTAGEKIARHFEHRLADLPAAGRAELAAISPAVQTAAWCQIMAGIELGRRVAAMGDLPATRRINSSQEAITFCQQQFGRLISDARQEEFHIVTLDTRNQVIDTHRITVGTLDASLVHPREVFRAAIRDAAASIILVHNHPSGDPRPSREDHQVTQRLEAVGETVGIRVLDHIVLGSPECISLRECQPQG